MIFSLVLYFIAGVIQDFLLTSNWRAVAKEKILYATLFSFLTTVISMVVIYNILTSLDADKSILAIVIYASGIATGTFIAMKLKIGSK